MTLEATVIKGEIVLTHPQALPEGAKVEVTILKDPPPQTNDLKPTLLGLRGFAGSLIDLPADFASEHDHYIHGTPKKSEKGTE